MSSKVFLQQRQYFLDIPPCLYVLGEESISQWDREREVFLYTGFPKWPDCAPIQEFAYLVHFSLMVLSALLLQN